jgi:hypothetical protein
MRSQFRGDAISLPRGTIGRWRKGIDWASPLILYALGFAAFFRHQLISHFDLMFGNPSDGRFVVFIHEHVYQWLLGRATLLSPPLFFDVSDTLGYSEVLLLDQLFYTPLRLAGTDPYLATSLVTGALSVISFASLYLLLSRLCVSSVLSSVAALLFTFSSGLFLTSAHLQHFTIYFFPVVGLSAAEAISTLHTSPRRALAVAGLGSLLCGLSFSTGFYMAWFLFLDLLIFIPIALCLCWRTLTMWFSTSRSRVMLLCLITSIGFATGLIPCLVIYLPVFRLMGYRAFSDYLLLAPQLSDIINVGPGNIVWGYVAQYFAPPPLNFRLSNPSEFTIAITPTVQVLSLAASVFASQRRLWPPTKMGSIARAIAFSAGVVPFIFFFCVMKIGNWSFFELLTATIPGAGAIRDGFRGMIVANLFAAVAVALTSNRIVQLLSQRSQMTAHLGLVSLWCVLGLAAVEQISVAAPDLLARASERQRFVRVGSPPSQCRSFFAADEIGRESYNVQLDAMLLAVRHNIPTINGYSGFVPSTWDFYDTKEVSYEKRAISWASRRGLVEGLCRLDITSGVWTLASQDPQLECAIRRCISFDVSGKSHEFHFEFGPEGNAQFFVDSGWSVPEAWGRWTSMPRASMSFTLSDLRDFEFQATLRPLVSAQAPNQSVSIEVNKCPIARASFDFFRGASIQTISGKVPIACIKPDGRVVIQIVTDQVSIPRNMGIGSDERELGIGIESMVLRTLPEP